MRINNLEVGFHKEKKAIIIDSVHLVIAGEMVSLKGMLSLNQIYSLEKEIYWRISSGIELYCDLLEKYSTKTGNAALDMWDEMPDFARNNIAGYLNCEASFGAVLVEIRKSYKNLSV